MPKSKNSLKRILGSKIFLFLIGIVLIVLIVNIGQESYKKHQLVKEIDQLKLEVGKLEGSNGQLADLMEYLKQDAYLEKEARVKLNLKKPGEKVVIIPERENSSQEETEQALTQGQSSDSKDAGANYWKWWEYFFASE